jgi:hypothetical protein
MQRRLEQLERQVARQQVELAGLIGRGPRGLGQRWVYLAQTIAPPGGGSYPTTGNTFWLQFLDGEYTATAGTQTVTKRTRAADGQVVGRTIFGQWVLPGEIVVAFPAPPPPNTTGKGVFWILAPFTHVGKADGAIPKGSTTGAGFIWSPTFSGTTGSRLTGLVNHTADLADTDRFSVTWDRGVPLIAPLECEES